MKRQTKISITNEKGVALTISLLVIMVLLIFGSIFVFGTIAEKNDVERQKQFIQAFYIAEAGGEGGLKEIDTLINTDLYTEINQRNPQRVARDASQFVANGDGLAFLLAYVKEGGIAQLTLNGDQLEYHGQETNFGEGQYQFDIYLLEKSDPVEISTDKWDFPFYYKIETVGTVEGISRKLVLVGDFTVRVQRDNFAKFALFTDHHTLPNGWTVWFTDKTNFAGPVHTNERFSFAFNPSGVFDGAVTQHLSKYRFYNNGNPILLNADDDSPYDVPVFHAGNTRGVDEIVLESSVQKQDLIDQARGPTTIPDLNGIFIPHDGSSLVGGIYVKGDSSIEMATNAQDQPVYTITEGGTTKIITVDMTNNQTTVETVGGGTEVYQGLPDGVDDVGQIIYVDGAITSLKGTIQKDTELTVSSENDIIITDNICYENYTPAQGSPGESSYTPPNADGTKNLFGIVCWRGDVRIGTNAPDNIEIHGTIMARNGVFTVDDYNDFGKGPRGTATLLGGVITQFYGAFGMFSGATGEQLSGYGRNFVYDSRMASGNAPPYFPSMKTFIAFTNDITDKITWQEGGM